MTFHGNHITTIKTKHGSGVLWGWGGNATQWNIGPTKADLIGKQKHIAMTVKTKPEYCICLLSQMI